MDLLKPSILKTLAYADIFDYPLTLEEINRYLLAPGALQARAPGASKLLAAGKISQSGKYYFLPHRQKLVDIRKTREQFSLNKLRQARSIAQKLAKLPNVLGVFVTGALAVANTSASDDIDLLIITRANKLWITRFLTTLYLEFMGIRRRPHTLKAANRICANMYLDETALSLPYAKRNLYTAHEIAQAKPLINKESIYERFLFANSWVLQYLPNTVISPTVHRPLSTVHCPLFTSHRPLSTVHRPPSTVHHSRLLEQIAYQLQYRYMKSKLTRETITPHSAFFHPRATSSEVLKKYGARMKLFQNPKSLPDRQAGKIQNLVQYPHDH
jgi:hypothetical protein